MASKEKRNTLPECSGKYKLDEVTDINYLQTRPYSGFRRTAVEFTCDSNEHSVSNLQNNGRTFIRFSGSTNGTSLNPAASVIPSNLNTGSTSGCFLENNSDGKSRAFDVENSVVPVKASDEYFLYVTIWKGVLINPVLVKTIRASQLVVQQTDRSHNELLPLKCNFCNGWLHMDEKRSHENENAAFYPRPKVGTRILFLKPPPRYFGLEEYC